MKKDKISSSADLFYYKANMDFNSAKYLFEAFKEDKIDIDIETIMFHLQQCAEKLLKALLSNKKIKINKTHDIELLINLSKTNTIKLPTYTDILIPLSEYAVEGRYAIIHDDIDDIDKYIEILEDFINFVKMEIS